MTVIHDKETGWSSSTLFGFDIRRQRQVVDCVISGSTLWYKSQKEDRRAKTSSTVPHFCLIDVSFPLLSSAADVVAETSLVVVVVVFDVCGRTPDCRILLHRTIIRRCDTDASCRSLLSLSQHCTLWDDPRRVSDHQRFVQLLVISLTLQQLLSLMLSVPTKSYNNIVFRHNFNSYSIVISSLMQTDIKFFCHFACYSVALSDVIRQNFQSLTAKISSNSINY